MAIKEIIGTSASDDLIADQDHAQVFGNAGDDTITFYQFGGTVFGGAGNDTFNLSSPGVAQVHAYGGQGDDTFNISTSAREAPYGTHAWGGPGSDKFVFRNLESSDERITGRLDDFNPVRDEIWIDDRKIDLSAPPSNVRLLEYQDQPWIMIDERVLYALEGARAVTNDAGEVAEEVHFINWPAEWERGAPASANLSYGDLLKRFPTKEADADNLPVLDGTSGDDQLSGKDVAEYIRAGDGRDVVRGNGGNDVIAGSERNDILYGGEGDDSLSGGLDQDRLYGGNGRDVAFGGSGHDIIYGESGSDSLAGNAGDDLIYGSAGDDGLYGGSGKDILVGGAGSDSLLGRDGDDLLIAGGAAVKTPGTNAVDGGVGNDTLVGADGQATEMNGGVGRDHFVAAGEGQVTISDFDEARDRLDLRGLVDPDADLADLLTRVERGEETDLLITLPEGGSALLVGAGGLSDANLAAATLREGAPLDVDRQITEQEKMIAGTPDLGGAAETRDEPPPIKPDEQPDNELIDDHRPPTAEEEAIAASHGGGGCFVATASFGGVSHPDVTWLRWLRDEHLAYHPAGRAFIRFYWTVGPILARFVQADRTSGRASRLILRGVVRVLKRLV